MKSDDGLNVASCKECLTDEEIALVLAPAALFAVETLSGIGWQMFTLVMAVLRHRGGIVGGRSVRERLALL